eukprot:CAMPEP_0176055302 /NCGR_PEP_ID=MMETSP0120_2-20121206/27529_1 /TAXON_ID=160619 /ORGANISM="Kryptoperidinium foliaceum, Strain CCMP 1326" /LENGTH=48 /DNA_ID= /DNA_START= /DNA_END= /DNA_ORIENTATION=
MTSVTAPLMKYEFPKKYVRISNIPALHINIQRKSADLLWKDTASSDEQ